MKSTIVILILTLLSYNNDIISVRNLFLSAYKSEIDCNNFGEKLSSINIDQSSLLTGYFGCYYLIKCKYVNSPIKKLSYFNKGKKLLDYAIYKDPTSVELRLLRYSIQKNMPKFLLYNDNIEEDIIFVHENLVNINDKSTKEFILYSLKTIDL